MRTIDIRGPQGNAFVILGFARQVYKELHELGVNHSFRYRNENNQLQYKTSNEVQSEMKSGDYDHLLDTFEKYFGDYVELEGRE